MFRLLPNSLGHCGHWAFRLWVVFLCCSPALSAGTISAGTISAGTISAATFSAATVTGFTVTFSLSGDLTVDHPDGITATTVGNSVEFTSGGETASITFVNNIFSVSVLSADAVLLSAFDGVSSLQADGVLHLNAEGTGGGNLFLTFGGTLVAVAGGFEVTSAAGAFGTGYFFPGESLPIGPSVNLSGTISIVLPPVITLADATQSIVSTSVAGGLVMSSISTVLNGAHSRPLSRLVDKGEKTGWVAGDWGVDHHDSRHGDLGLAEVGMGYHFGFAQINLALGKTWSDQDTLLGGSIEADGKFVMVEGIIPVAGIDGLHATVTGYRHWGDVDLERGYLNAGTPDFSTASPDSRTWGLRARLDWQNAFSWRNADYTPYVDLSYSDSHLDSFTEVGGAFPAFFDDKDEEITELRLGVNGELPLFSDRVRLLGNLEAAHRFDDDGSRTSGQLIGLFSFDLPGTDYDQNWFKAGIGVEGNLGKGKASLMINGTTEGEMPSAWAAFAYQVRF